MNSCILMAEIVQEPELRHVNNDNMMAIAEMMVQFPGLRAEDAPARLKVVGWGKLAEEIQQKYHTGDRVIIEGRLSMNTVERQEGFKEKRAELTVQRIFSVGADVSMDTATSSYAASESAERSRPPEAEKKTVSVGAATKSEPAKAATQSKPPLPNTQADIDDIPFRQPVEFKTVFGDDLIDSEIHRPRVGFEFHKF